jgi:hypothetical protein
MGETSAPSTELQRTAATAVAAPAASALPAGPLEETVSSDRAVGDDLPLRAGPANPLGAKARRADMSQRNHSAVVK